MIFFVLGTGETLADTASSAFVPAIVSAESLPTANSLLVAPWLLRTFGATALLRAGLLIEIALHATLAAVRSPVPARGMIVIFGIHTVVCGVVVTTIRQRTLPSAMFGRVTSVYALLDLGGAALGSLLGGLVAQAYGIVATFWTAAAAMVLVAAVAWRPLSSATGVFRAARAPVA